MKSLLFRNECDSLPQLGLLSYPRKFGSASVATHVWRTNRKFCTMGKSKVILGFMVILVSAGCGRSPQTSEPTPEIAPWLYPQKQIELLKAADFKARAMAARNLGNMGAAAEVAIPELEKLLEDENPKVRVIAKEALEKIRAVVDRGSSS
jgi:hypothetical protein